MVFSVLPVIGRLACGSARDMAAGLPVDGVKKKAEEGRIIAALACGGDSQCVSGPTHYKL